MTEATGFAVLGGSTGSATNGEFFLFTELPTGNNDIIITILDDDVAGTFTAAANEIVFVIDGEFDFAQFKFTYPDAPPDFTVFENDAVRLTEITLIETAVNQDITLAFDIQGTDGDGDTTQTESFNVYIDGDGDGIVPANVVNSAAGNENLVAGAGLNLFVYDAIGDALDTITGFDTDDPVLNGDLIDISAVLVNFLGATVADAVAANFLEFVGSGAGGIADTDIRVDTDGGGDGFVTLATLVGVGFTSEGASTTELSDNIIVA